MPPKFDLLLNRPGVDRRANDRREVDLLPRLLADPDTNVLDWYAGRAPVRPDGTLAFRSPRSADQQALSIFLGVMHDGPALLVVHPERAGDDVAVADLRTAGETLDDEQRSILATAAGIANWHATQGFCPQDGSPTVPVEAGWARQCAAEGHYHYPRTDPAVIMSVIDPDDRLLLAQGTRFGTREGEIPRMSVLAGFVEPGESLAAAVAREVQEEVGVSVRDAQYLGDQPWPFPASLMIGYVAYTDAPALDTDPHEIVAARWFTRDELTDDLRAERIGVPPRLSIARHLIEHWYGGPLPVATRW